MAGRMMRRDLKDCGRRRLLRVLPAVAMGLVLSSWAVAARGDSNSETGQQLYQEYCASCHGAKLEGQPNWKRPLPSGRMPAPPHDASGHTWHHADRVLFKIIKLGPAGVVGSGYKSDMPGFGETLTDAEIRTVLNYIKSTWPARERKYQAEQTRADKEVRR